MVLRDESFIDETIQQDYTGREASEDLVVIFRYEIVDCDENYVISVVKEEEDEIALYP